MSYRIEYYKGKRGYYLRVVARNGKIVADGGEPYSTIGNALRAAKRLRASIANCIITKS